MRRLACRVENAKELAAMKKIAIVAKTRHQEANIVSNYLRMSISQVSPDHFKPGA